MASPRKRLGSARLLADVYGCAAQGDNLERDDFEDRYVRQLRFDSLFARRIVVVDTHFLDGAFFTRCAPSTLIELTGRGVHAKSLPIEVRTRPSRAPARKRLAGALRNFLLRPDSQFLNGFEFNAIADRSARVELSVQLARTPQSRLASRIDGVSDDRLGTAMASFLKDLIGPSDIDIDLDQIGAGWSLWIEAEEAGQLNAVPWGAGGFDIVRALTVDLPLDPAVLESDDGRGIHQDVIRLAVESSYRTDVTQLLRRFRESHAASPGSPTAMDIEVIDQWYFAARYIAEARNHHADVAYHFNGHGALNGMERSLQLLGQGRCEPDVVVPNELIPGLGALTGSQYGALTDSLRPQLETVWRRGTVADVRKLLTDLNTEMAKTGFSPPPSRLPEIAGIAVAAGVGVAGAFNGVTPVATLVNAGLAGAAPVAAAAIERWRAKGVRPGSGRVIQHLESIRK
jgi:hypothetical protein